MSGLDDLEGVVRQYHLALGEIVKGNSEPLKTMYSHTDDVTLANPFGPAKRGWEQVAETMDLAATHYKDGEVVGFENLANYAGADLAYLVEVERFAAKVGGSEEVSPLALRVTSVLRLEDGTWKVVHRHADPITTVQPVESVIQK